ncbi:hypothetical protein MCOR03_010022 [Pyricularia oryzae]|uniref:Uncharacterized protein n=2 Tax=Pyricularia TaxID=48558 RepID=A0ABQ8N535_PYRGI|nr:hypothetical protein MCOR01_005435 [Pyricularia oryzae]KAI6291048.1 hypothetical protein MCOR33_010876 [Pyricularia grisea]KAI6252565.1 hypothetical protein MCOR19_010833 [Pyricularia oryzae]KAI6387930.1 hypothetical protein MCOR23_010922 [Pyricularia oryzae]KAI6393179.1 hypothetical protein MCOR20_010911 [Pyricularia oryzae]
MSGIQLRRPVAKSGHGRSFSEGSRKVDEPIDGLMQEFKQLKDASTGKTQCKPSEEEEIRALKIRACDLALQLSGEMPQQQLEVLRGVVANLERHVAGQSQHQDESREYDQQVSQLNLEGLTVEDDASSIASDPTIASLVEADRILWIKHKVWDTYMEYEGTAPRYFPDCGPFEVKIPAAYKENLFLDAALEEYVPKFLDLGTEINVKGPEEGPDGPFYKLSVWLTMTPEREDFKMTHAASVIEVWMKLLRYYLRICVAAGETDEVHWYFEDCMEDKVRASAQTFGALREQLIWHARLRAAAVEVANSAPR